MLLSEKITKKVADIVFCIDCTNAGAIRNCMEFQIIKFVESLNTCNQNNIYVDWRARVIGYGDIEYNEPVQNNSEFIHDVDLFRRQLCELEAYSGGDDPESTLDAICYAALDSKWRDRCERIIIVLTDAPTKSLHVSTMCKFNIRDFKELMKALVDNHIRLFLWGETDPIYESMKQFPKSHICLWQNAYEYLYTAKLDLTEYIDKILVVHGCNPYNI